MATTTKEIFSQKFAERPRKKFSYCVLNYARADGPPHGIARDAGQVCRWNTLVSKLLADGVPISLIPGRQKNN